MPGVFFVGFSIGRNRYPRVLHLLVEPRPFFIDFSIFYVEIFSPEKSGCVI